MRLLHGDCLDLLPGVADGSVDMVFADLPYGVTANKWDSVIPFEPLWAELLRVGRRNAAFVFTATQPFATALICSQPKLFRYDLVWERNRPGCFVHARRMPLRAHETLLVFYRQPPTYTAQKEPGDNYSRDHSKGRSNGGNLRPGKKSMKLTHYEGRYPRSVLKFASAENRSHPTQKPVALLEWLVKTYTNPGDTVLDPTAGSFTTGVACVNTGRDFIGMEKDATYFEIGQRRVMAAQPPLPGAA